MMQCQLLILFAWDVNMRVLTGMQAGAGVSISLVCLFGVLRQPVDPCLADSGDPSKAASAAGWSVQ